MKDDKRLKRKVRNSYIVSTVSITLVLFLLGSVGYLMVAALKVADTLQESIAVTVELKNGLSEAQKETISKRLTAEEMVATIAYSAKEEKAEEEEFCSAVRSRRSCRRTRCWIRSNSRSRRHPPTRSCSTRSSPPPDASKASTACRTRR